MEEQQESKQAIAFGDRNWTTDDRLAWSDFMKTKAGRRLMTQIVRLKRQVYRETDSELIYSRKLEFNNCVDDVATHLVLLTRSADDLKPQKAPISNDNIDFQQKNKSDEESQTVDNPLAQDKSTGAQP